MKKETLLLSSVLLLIGTQNAQSITLSGDITGTISVPAGVNQLDGFVCVRSGGVLDIAPGAIIKASTSSSTLIIARGGRINAIGTRTNPIIFTTQLDEIPVRENLTRASKGLWGGVILLGRAQPAGSNPIEGLPASLPASCRTFGGSQDDDDSGTLRYVQIRHGGFELTPGNEVNCLTMGGVGSGTRIRFVECFANLDDGFEFFGGTVRPVNLVAAFGGDDSFDIDQGSKGRGRFWLDVHDSLTDKCLEAGGTGTGTAVNVANLTCCGDGDDDAFDLDRGGILPANLRVRNSYVVAFDNCHTPPGTADLGDVVGNTAGSRYAGITNPATCAPLTLQTPRRITCRVSPGGLDPTPTSGIQGVPAGNFVGAFADGDDRWLCGWTALQSKGHLAPSVCP